MDWEKEFSRADLKAFYDRVRKSIWWEVFLGGAFFLAIWFLMTWQISFILMGAVGVHEYGHMWAMKRYGLTNVRFHFIPFLGGVTIGEGMYPSQKRAASAVLMGPVFGLFPAPILLAVALLTSSPSIAALSTVVAFLSLFNLFPFMPLDGGKIVALIAASEGKSAERAIHGVIFVSGLVLAITLDSLFLIMIAVIGSVFFGRRPTEDLIAPKMNRKEAIATFAAYFGVGLASILLVAVAMSVEGISDALDALLG